MSKVTARDTKEAFKYVNLNVWKRGSRMEVGGRDSFPRFLLTCFSQFLSHCGTTFLDASSGFMSYKLSFVIGFFHPLLIIASNHVKVKRFGKEDVSSGDGFSD